MKSNITLEQFSRFGNVTITPYAVIDEKNVYPVMTSCEGGQYDFVCEGLFKESLYIDTRENHIRCRRTFENISGRTLNLNELGLTLANITFGKTARDDFFYHNENPRIYEVMSFPIDYKRTSADAKDSNFDLQAGNRWADPGVVCERIGRSPYQPFPAILLGNYQEKAGLVHGTLSQRVFYHNYLVNHAEDSTVTCEVFSSFKDLAYLEVADGRVLTDCWYLGTTEDVTDLETIFQEYADVLREILPPMYGATKINRDNMVWGSWNDGIYRHITEDMLLKEARYLKANFPTVRWIQVDDGYANRGLDESAHGLGCIYEGEDAIHPDKFPNGMRHYTDELRKIGLRPAIWIGGFCPRDTKIVKERPEWFIDYSYRVPKSSPLDVSIPEVRDYMTHALDVFLGTYGFEAVKHDFWSYAFEDSHDLYRNKDKSGYEYRDWWLTEMRKRLAPDGYFQTGCDIVMGNPFLGEHFTNYRYGIDIGGGNWDFVRTNYQWGMACFATHTNDLIVPNSDSVGLFPGLNDTEAMFCLNYCLVTHTMVEIAGKLSENPDSPRLPFLKKAVCNPNNGQDVFFAKYKYLDPKQKYPAILYFKTGHFTPAEDQDGLPVRSVGLFNLEDEEITLSFQATDLKIPAGIYQITNVWTNETQKLDGEFTVKIPAHGSALFAINKTEGLQLLDADIRVMKSQYTCCGKLELTFDYGAEATFQFNKMPECILINGEKADFITVGENMVKLNIPADAVMKVS
jgi:hypothetical protein